MSAPLRSVLMGLGRVGLGYLDDPKLTRFYRYIAHAQVLVEHPEFDWIGAVDPDPQARAAAAARWPELRIEATPASLNSDAPEVVVDAAPPSDRRARLEMFPTARALLVEKPLGASAIAARAYVEAASARRALVQVNLWRRCDALFSRWADGGLRAEIGEIQGGLVVYGGGVRNNGVHCVDFVRMTLGEPLWVQALAARPVSHHAADPDINFVLGFPGGRVVTVMAVDFGRYREIGMDFWGTDGRLQIMNEGLTIRRHARRDNRSTTGADEIDDVGDPLQSCVGTALYDVYSDLADAIRKGRQPRSDLRNAWRSTMLVETIVQSLEIGAQRLPWSERLALIDAGETAT